MIWNRNKVVRSLFCAASATVMFFVHLPSIHSKNLQSNTQGCIDQNIDDCDIDDSDTTVEICPAESIICQYKEKYDVTLTLRGGTYWQVLSGQYVNHQFGYTVDIPYEVEALCTPPPNPRHGFFVDVRHVLEPPSVESDDRGGFWLGNLNLGVYVEADYNALLYESADDAIEEDLSWHKISNPKGLQVLRRGHAELQGENASTFLIRFVAYKTGEALIEDQLVVIRKVVGEVGIVYTLGLVTTPEHYAEDKQVLRSISTSFRFTNPE